MSVSGHSQPGGYPQYPGVGRYPSTHSTQPMSLSTSFMSSPPGPTDSKSDYSRGDTSTMHLMPTHDRMTYSVDYRHAILATVMCPILGLKSLFHTRQARKELDNGNKVRAASHIHQSNTFYGYSMCLGFALWLFILAIIFVVVVHYLISIRHYSVAIPNRFINNQ